MKFKKSLENLKSAKSAKIQSDKNLVLAETKVKKTRSKIEEAHEGLTDLLARAEVEEVEKDSIEKARQEYDSAKSDFEEAKTALEVAKKVIPLCNTKLQRAKEQFKEPAFHHYRKEAEPLIDELLKVLDDYGSVFGKIEEMKKEIDSHGLSGTNFLPSKIESFKVNHIRTPYSLDRYRKRIKELKS